MRVIIFDDFCKWSFRVRKTRMRPGTSAGIFSIICLDTL
jgi:hypothetical protein